MAWGRNLLVWVEHLWDNNTEVFPCNLFSNSENVYQDNCLINMDSFVEGYGWRFFSCITFLTLLQSLKEA